VRMSAAGDCLKSPLIYFSFPEWKGKMQTNLDTWASAQATSIVSNKHKIS